jgi:hypothetical protein
MVIVIEWVDPKTEQIVWAELIKLRKRKKLMDQICDLVDAQNKNPANTLKRKVVVIKE